MYNTEPQLSAFRFKNQHKLQVWVEFTAYLLQGNLPLSTGHSCLAEVLDAWVKNKNQEDKKTPRFSLYA